MQEDLERKLAAVMSADAANYSGLMAADDAATVRTIGKLRSEFAARIHQHRGRVVDAPGDNVLAEFPSVVNAVACALHVQQSIARHNESLAEARRMRFRIGIHTGEVIVEEGRIYGDPVNIAARLEHLAEPGGVLVSNAVAAQLPRGQTFALEYNGSHQLKNIPEPVETFRVRDHARSDEGEGDASERSAVVPYARQLSVPGFSGQPAIAVLPFQPFDAGDESEGFAMGLAEDLITRLSAWRAYPVLAHTSTAGYSRVADVTRLRNELRVGYVIKGSVRRSAERVRIGAQLVDVDSAQVVWAKTYDEQIGELFAMQDAIAESVTTALEPTLRRAELKRSLHRNPRDLNAWECVQRGQWHMVQLRREDNQAAQALFRRAVEIDPTFATGYGFLGISLAFDAMFGWTQSPRGTLDEAIAAADRGLSLDDENPFVYRALGGVYVFDGKLRQAIEANLKAIELSPSYALGYWGAGQQLALSGKPNEGLAMLRTAMRLSPSDPLTGQFLADLAIAYFGAERYDEAVETAERSLSMRGDANWCWPFMIAGLVQADRLHEAQRAARKVPEALQGLTSDAILHVLTRMGAEERLVERLGAGLRAVQL